MLHTPIADDLELFLLMPHHAPALYALLQANRAYWGEWISWVHRVETLDDVRGLIERGLNELAEGSAIRFGLRYRGELAGRIFYSYIDTDSARLEIGYQIGQAFAGKGIISRAVPVLLDDAFGEMGMQKVDILCAVHNTRSRRIPEKLGFQLEGIIRHAERVDGQPYDLAVYGMLAEEWHNRSQPTGKG